MVAIVLHLEAFLDLDTVEESDNSTVPTITDVIAIVLHLEGFLRLRHGGRK